MLKTSNYLFFINLGDNCVQKFNFGRYIVGYTDGNIAGYTVANFDVIQSDVTLQNQVH